MRNWVLAVLVLGACKGPSANTSPTEPEPLPLEVAQVAPDPAPVVAAPPDARLPESPIPAATTQLIVSLSDGWTGTDAILHRYQREVGGPWQEVGDPIASTLGHGGLGWGRGLHTVDAPDEPIKHEGDGRSPAGVFHIGKSYGYASSPTGTTLPFQQVDRKWRCVNDTKSSSYNRVLDMKTTTKDWDEAERMRRHDHIYEIVIEVDHNHIVPSEQAPTPGDGSCIFLHVWRRPGAPTIGCTAMPLPAMRELLTWLSPQAAPVIVALPKERYETLRAAWALPQRP